MKRRVGEAPLVRDEPQETTVHVDVTLIDEMLRLTPKQRLEQNDRMATLAVRLRRLMLPVLEETLKRRRRGTAT